MGTAEEATAAISRFDGYRLTAATLRVTRRRNVRPVVPAAVVVAAATATAVVGGGGTAVVAGGGGGGGYGGSGGGYRGGGGGTGGGGGGRLPAERRSRLLHQDQSTSWIWAGREAGPNSRRVRAAPPTRTRPRLGPSTSEKLGSSSCSTGIARVPRVSSPCPPTSRTTTGQRATRVYGFTSMLPEGDPGRAPGNIAVAFDTPDRNFRYDLYADYKAGRSQAHDTFAASFRSSPVLRVLRIPVVTAPGWEADDALATLATQASADVPGTSAS